MANEIYVVPCKSASNRRARWRFSIRDGQVERDEKLEQVLLELLQIVLYKLRKDHGRAAKPEAHEELTFIDVH
jgi:hypothetical protein